MRVSGEWVVVMERRQEKVRSEKERIRMYYSTSIQFVKYKLIKRKVKIKL